MTVQECVQRCANMTMETIRYYMGRPDVRYHIGDSWKNRLIIAICDGKIPVETMDNFVHVVAYYNKNIY